MTNEELIRYGKDYLHDLVTACCPISDIHKEFVREAVKALEQQPCDDCVDKNHVIATISQHHFDKDKDNFDLLIHNLCKEINELPPVTPIFPKGATNGDMIIAMFPAVEVKEKNNGYEVYFGVGTAFQFFNHQWWNAPYKRGNEND